MKKIVLGLLMVLATGCTKDDKANDTVTDLPSVIIGSQTWTTKNLDVATYSDGTVIPQVTDPTEWKNSTTGAWCYYNNDAANGNTYGKLYNWYAVAGIWNEASKTDVSQRKKLAPSGYHVPSDDECATLVIFLGGESIAGGKMKEIGNLHWNIPNTDATNIVGFTGLPAGFRSSSGRFVYLGEYTFYINITDHYADMAGGGIQLDYNLGQAHLGMMTKAGGGSVRCIKD
jgi:uncharacterized protein (TIGR02145 family)